jgi:hypothetical protein
MALSRILAQSLKPEDIGGRSRSRVPSVFPPPVHGRDHYRLGQHDGQIRRGANFVTTLFSLVDAILLRPLPFPDPGAHLQGRGADGARPGLLLASRGLAHCLENFLCDIRTLLESRTASQHLTWREKLLVPSRDHRRPTADVKFHGLSTRRSPGLGLREKVAFSSRSLLSSWSAPPVRAPSGLKLSGRGFRLQAPMPYNHERIRVV